jgi:hypothetical protein
MVFKTTPPTCAATWLWVTGWTDPATVCSAVSAPNWTATACTDIAESRREA